MLRIFAVILLVFETNLMAGDTSSEKLIAPDGWSGETIKLPPNFAPDVKLKGVEHIRFAPGMMRPESGSFFCYAFVFELQPKPVLTETVVKGELLKYYQGLCTAVLNGKFPAVDPSAFRLELRRVESDINSSSDKFNAGTAVLYTGTLDWVEPFATQNPQKLNMEIRTWTRDVHNYLFVCVSPQTRDSAIWKQLHTIRDRYLEK